jgi:hypothetical protein
MLTAEYGGTGGLPIESGMVVEEPDIEIGAGVSSKGMFPILPSINFPFPPSPLPLSPSVPFFFLLLHCCSFYMLVVHNGVHRSHSHSSSLHSNKPAHGD